MNSSAAHKILNSPLTGQRPIPKNEIKGFTVAPSWNYLLLKRVFDLLLSSLTILFVLSWLLPLLAILIKLDSAGPVFFIQKRIGKEGRVFPCLKLRTMYPNELADDIPAGPHDPRITRFGKFLRRTNLDELPQFFNVLMGQMSVIGPRPHMVSDSIRFSFVVPSYNFRNTMRPGITGWAQVNGYHGLVLDKESIMLRYYWDAQYIRKADLWLDLKILLVSCLQFLGFYRN